MTRRFLIPPSDGRAYADGASDGFSARTCGSARPRRRHTLGSPSLYLYQQWVDDSYAPTYPGVVQFTFSAGPFPCGAVAGAAGCTTWSQWPVPQVTVDAGNGPYLAHEYEMHELGHVFDATEMQDPFRAEFMAIWGLPAAPAPGGRRLPTTPRAPESGSRSPTSCARCTGRRCRTRRGRSTHRRTAFRATTIRPSRTRPAG